jgi:hypothetical protein
LRRWAQGAFALFGVVAGCSEPPVIFPEPALAGMRTLVLYTQGDALRAEAVDLTKSQSVRSPLDTNAGLTVYAAAYRCPLDVLGLSEGTLELLPDEGRVLPDALVPEVALEANVAEGAASSWAERPPSYEPLQALLARLPVDPAAACRRFVPLFRPIAVEIPDTKETELTFVEPVSETSALVGVLDGRLFMVDSETNTTEMLTVLSTSAMAAYRGPNSMFVVGRGGALYRADTFDTFRTVIPPSSSNPDPYRYAWLSGRYLDGDNVELLMTTDGGKLYSYTTTTATASRWRELHDQERSASVEGAPVLITGGAALVENERYFIEVLAGHLFLGNPIPTTVNQPKMFRYEGLGRTLTNFKFPGNDSQYPTAVASLPNFGVVAGTFLGGLVQLEDGQQLSALPSGDFVLPVLAIAEYETEVLLYGGTGGYFGAYHPDGGYCVAENFAAPDVRQIVQMGDGIVLLSRPAIPKDLRDQTITLLEPIEPRGQLRCD